MSKPTKAQLQELEELRKLEYEAIRTVALDSTWLFGTHVLFPDVAAKHYYEPTHKPIWDWMDAAPKGSKRGLVCTREFRKTMSNVMRCTRLICKYPDIRIMLISALQRTAIDMCGLIKRQFMINQSFRHYYPEFAINDPKFGKIDEFTVPWRKSTSFLDPTFFATYLGAPLISRRADIVILDDPVDEDMVANPDLAQATMDKFTQIIPLVDKTSDFRQIFFMGTIKAYNDPISVLRGNAASSDVKVDKEAVNDWEIVVRPISYVPTGNFHDPGPFQFPDENPEARPALPNVHTPEMIREIYNECCKNPNKGEQYFWKEFGCIVVAPGDQRIKPEWLNSWVEPQQVPLNTVFSGLSIDSALKDEQVLQKGDHMVYLVGHYDQWGNLYLTDGGRSRAWRAEDFRKVLISTVQAPKNRGVQNVLREKVGEGTFFPMVRGWFNDAKLPCVLHPLRMVGQGRKYLRILEALQAPLQGRKIFFVKGQFPEDIHKVLVDELTHLGQWGHDDVADCLATFYHPEIRVVPSGQAKTSWTSPITRPLQNSLDRNNPAAASAVRQWQAFRVTPSQGPLKTTSDVLLREDGKSNTFSVADTGMQRRPPPFDLSLTDFLKD